MKIFLLIAIIVVAIAIFAIYRLIVVKRQRRQLYAQRFERVKPLYEKLAGGQSITEQEVLPYAQNILTREAVFRLLYDYQKTAFFPQEYHTLIKGAESNLANWLELPTELDACPDEMEHVKRVTIDYDGQQNFVHYEVFKYRTNEPHWAAKNGWMLGVVGPYFDDSEPYDFPHATFSRADSMEKTSPEEEAKWVHEHISKRS